MNYFIDTSSLIKIYHKEEGSQKVIDLYKSEVDINISELAVIEFISTIYRKFREHEIGFEVLNILTEKFQNDIEYRYEVLNFSSMVFDEAFSLIKKYAKINSLKTLDAIQFAFFTTYSEEEDVFVSSDKILIHVLQISEHNIYMP